MRIETLRKDGSRGPSVYAKDEKSFLTYIKEVGLKLTKVYESKKKPSKSKKTNTQKEN